MLSRTQVCLLLFATLPSIIVGLSADQKVCVCRLSEQIDKVKPNSNSETKLFKNLAIVLNDRTAVEAFLTDPNSNSYRAGLISLAQAIKQYAWRDHYDQQLMSDFQTVANRLRELLAW